MYFEGGATFFGIIILRFIHLSFKILHKSLLLKMWLLLLDHEQGKHHLGALLKCRNLGPQLRPTESESAL